MSFETRSAALFVTGAAGLALAGCDRLASDQPKGERGTGCDRAAISPTRPRRRCRAGQLAPEYRQASAITKPSSSRTGRSTRRTRPTSRLAAAEIRGLLDARGRRPRRQAGRSFTLADLRAMQSAHADHPSRLRRGVELHRPVDRRSAARGARSQSSVEGRRPASSCSTASTTTTTDYTTEATVSEPGWRARRSTASRRPSTARSACADAVHPQTILAYDDARARRCRSSMAHLCGCASSASSATRTRSISTSIDLVASFAEPRRRQGRLLGRPGLRVVRRDLRASFRAGFRRTAKDACRTPGRAAPIRRRKPPFGSCLDRFVEFANPPLRRCPVSSPGLHPPRHVDQWVRRAIFLVGGLCGRGRRRR